MIHPQTSLVIPDQINAQIGHKAFVMMGTNQKSGTQNSLTFNVRGSKTAKNIKITLNPDDTYTMEFFNQTIRQAINNGVTPAKTVPGLYADQLHKTIEEFTGLYLSL